MERILFTNVSVIDGVAVAPYPADVLVEGERIAAVAAAPKRLSAAGVQVIDGGGATLMPGLVEAHAHLSFCNNKELQEFAQLPVEEHVIACIENAKLLLMSGAANGSDELGRNLMDHPFLLAWAQMPESVGAFRALLAEKRAGEPLVVTREKGDRTVTARIDLADPDARRYFDLPLLARYSAGAEGSAFSMLGGVLFAGETHARPTPIRTGRTDGSFSLLFDVIHYDRREDASTLRLLWLVPIGL